ncbi:hypothetical protein A3C23_03040 [Candidatus Roizmanbacteria bacterium RIFCSPHIGHO2_02_FULL_37_13b]|uniref:Uncharacterized protein n=1 Tax=Candidatus Roizmanbacteria bacterium RIFCSPLOWO2_02_FULL_36_11 TaxID=1802071 RepID=A0A1F7JI88_9BACT|nr:MAG: hypothetical protein A3C23_03040 [Candidatus Roizmanbacteria bacterium RIFCSPHIGHO2_02_FULL_37_13b]OGK55326.1 MAG: hypothetical protein A3H78_04475 [Candidatus Roizmanbacteria bacterium RIFCSPLOWO2_02_FULL_36_11]
MNNFLCQKLIISLEPDPTGGASSGPFEIQGPLVGPNGTPINTMADVISIVLKFLIPFAGILLFVYLVWGGFTLLTSQGEPEKIGSGKKKITYAIFGFILLVFSYLLVGIISRILGVGLGIF